jgi:hypothetical protein
VSAVSLKPITFPCFDKIRVQYVSRGFRNIFSDIAEALCAKRKMNFDDFRGTISALILGWKTATSALKIKKYSCFS